MPEPLIDALIQLVSDLVGREPGSNAFYVVLGVSLAVGLAVARLFAGLFGSDKGIVAAFFALSVPLALGMVTHGLVTVYLVPHFEADWAALWLPWVGFGLLALCGILAASRNLLGLGPGLTMATFLFAVAAAIGGWYGSGIAVDLIQKSEDKAVERNEQVEESIRKAN